MNDNEVGTSVSLLHSIIFYFFLHCTTASAAEAPPQILPYCVRPSYRWPLNVLNSHTFSFYAQGRGEKPPSTQGDGALPCSRRPSASPQTAIHLINPASSGFLHMSFSPLPLFTRARYLTLSLFSTQGARFRQKYRGGHPNSVEKDGVFSASHVALFLSLLSASLPSASF